MISGDRCYDKLLIIDDQYWSVHHVMTPNFLPLPWVCFTSIRTSSWNFCLVEFAIPTQVLLAAFRWFSGGFPVVFRTTWSGGFWWSSDLRWSSPGIQVILILLLGGSLVLWGLVVIIVHIVNLTRHICKSNQNFGYQRSGHDRTGKLRREMRKVLMKTKIVKQKSEENYQ